MWHVQLYNQYSDRRLQIYPSCHAGRRVSEEFVDLGVAPVWGLGIIFMSWARHLESAVVVDDIVDSADDIEDSAYDIEDLMFGCLAPVLSLTKCKDVACLGALASYQVRRQLMS